MPNNYVYSENNGTYTFTITQTAVTNVAEPVKIEQITTVSEADVVDEILFVNSTGSFTFTVTFQNASPYYIATMNNEGVDLKYIFIQYQTGQQIMIFKYKDSPLPPGFQYATRDQMIDTGIESSDNFSYTPFDITFLQEDAPCLLPGTLIKTPTSYIPIENLQIGDLILSHQNKPVKVTYVEQAKVKNNECDHERCLSKKVFKMVKGTYGLTQDLYITRNHEVVIDGSLVLPETLCEKTDPAEYCDKNGWFDIYNLRLEEDGNHLIVNGECVVVSLNSSTVPEPKKADADTNAEPKLEPEPKPRCKNLKCQGSVIKIK
jgi:hypothetical protein